MTDFYSILGIQRDATAAQIRRAHRVLASKWHPDRNKDPEAHDQFVRIQQAYECLADDDARAHYDRTGSAPPPVNQVAEQARAGVVQLFIQIADQQGWRPYNYVVRMRELIGIELDKARQSIRTIDRRFASLAAVLPDAGDAENLFQRAVFHQQQRLGAEKLQAENTIAQSEFALDLLKGYRDTFEEPTMMFVTFGSSGTSSATGNL